MPSEPELIVNTEPALSIAITSSKSSSVTSAPLHDLAILKIFGKLKMSYITDYLNKQYNSGWSGDEMVQILHLWIDEYRATIPGSKQRHDYEQTINGALEPFYRAISNEISDSSYEADIQLDYKADGRVTNLSSAPEGIGAYEETTSEENAFNEDLADWTVASARGDKDLGPKPSKRDPDTGEPNPKYYYKAPPPKNMETGLAE
ncbi:MAG: hypothetical protein LQ349_008244 [Xanthoria aureola]|nr:MAG: hypothetical protein LQ349_008244 [Xanthoria aureola]